MSIAAFAAILHSSPLAAAALDIQAVDVASFEPGDRSKSLFGALTYRGGLALSSQDGAFGGFSGMWLDKGGTRLIAVSDRGSWLTATIAYEGQRPVGLSQAQMLPMLGPKGQPLAKTRQGDVEALSISGGTAVVGIERTHELMGFQFDGGDPADRLPATRGRLIAFPKDVRDALFAADSNEGFEAVLLLGSEPNGRILAIGEHSLDAAGNLRGWIIENGKAAEFSVAARPGDFSLTDVALAPGGRLLLLERHFSFRRGLFVRLRSLSLADIAPAAVVDGPVLLDASYSQEIDNFEAMAVHTADDGATVVTLLSDDNFSPLQRTLLMQFTLAPAGAQPAP